MTHGHAEEFFLHLGALGSHGSGEARVRSVTVVMCKCDLTV